jgi:hypothetical protein
MFSLPKHALPLSLLFYLGLLLIGYPFIHAPLLAADETKEIERLVSELGSDRFQAREKAMESLRKIGKKALPALRKAQNNSDLEIRRRAKLLVLQLEEGIQALLDRGATIDFYTGKPKNSPSSVDRVYMVGKFITDDDLLHLREFVNMRHLTIIDAPISNKGLDRIKHLTNLDGLTLTGTSVSDLSSLRKLTKLGGLCLGSTKLTDESLTVLKDLPNLRVLCLDYTAITDAGLANIAHLKDLCRLNLEKTRITDKGLVHLKGLKELTHLGLKATQITDAGLVHLKELKKLQVLHLHRTETTPKGIEDLHKALPEWLNYRSFAPHLK